LFNLALEVDTESPSRRCKTEVENIYDNRGKAWVVGLFHSSFKEELLDEFLNGFLMNYWMNVNFKSLRKTRKQKQLKKLQETKIMLGIRRTPCVTQIHEISKMMIHHL